jgi:hypothetical protein
MIERLFTFDSSLISLKGAALSSDGEEFLLLHGAS